MAKDYHLIWKNCLAIIKDNIPESSYKTWFEPIVPIKLKSNILTIQVPSHFFYEYLEAQYIDLLSKVLRRELGAEAKLEYSIVMENSNVNNNKPVTVKYPATDKVVQPNKPVSVPLDENTIKNPFIIPGLKKIQINSQLNSNCTFANFVEGDCNRLARSAGMAVADKPGGTAFNPLFIYGGSGLGKTHLVQAIGVETKERHPEKQVLYVSANKFQQQYTEAVRYNTQNDFLHFYQMIDLLIIDDVQELAGKDKTQNTFFHIFNHLHQTGKQLILTSDKAPVELKGMEQRLLSRFKWGLSADLATPDFDTRKRILKQKIYNDGLTINDEIITYIAENINTNVRELEGTLISLLAQASHNKRNITIDLARQLIDRLVQYTKHELTIDDISQAVCEYFQMDNTELHSKSRKREVVQARQIVMYFSKNFTNSSLSSIGSRIGNKDHATVLHAVKTVNNLIETDKRFKVHVDEIKKKLRV